ncbi:MAG: TraB/GumN family protein [Acidobacteriota bacterium]
MILSHSKKAITAGIALASLLCASLLAHAPQAHQKSCLWKVRSKTSVMYLLGSIHILKKEAYPLSPAIEEAFNDSRKLVVEVDLDGEGQNATRALMLSKGLYSGGRTLSQTISSQAFEKAKVACRELGLSLDRMSFFKPWLLAITLTALKLQTLGFDPEYGIDKYFSDKARTTGKSIIGLETLEYQVGRFEAMSEQLQESLLLQTLDELETVESEFDQIVNSWSKGDLTGLETLLESFKEYPEAYQLLLVERNRNWMPQIESLLKDKQNCLVVVGAAHLIGEDGLVRMLKDRGYSPEQL